MPSDITAIVRRIALSMVVCLTLCQQASFGQAIDGYTAARHDRFLNYPSSPTANPDFFGASADLSGIGWDVISPNVGIMMITPQHFIQSSHYLVGGNLGYSFLNRDGVIKTYADGGYLAPLYLTVDNVTYQSDLQVRRLAAPIPDADHISFYPVAVASDIAAYIAREIWVYKQYAQVGRNQITDIVAAQGGPYVSVTAMYDYNPAQGYSPDEAHLSPFDSSSPTLMPVNGQLTALGAHIGIDGDNNSYDSFLPFYIDQINAQLAQESGPHYTIQTIDLDLPEPAATVTLLLGFKALLLRRPPRFQNFCA